MTTSHVEEVLHRLTTSLPVPVKGWKVDVGTDSTGDDAVWVWAVLDDANLTRSVRTEIRESITDAVSRAAQGPAPLVYVRFRAVSEV